MEQLPQEKLEEIAECLRNNPASIWGSILIDSFPHIDPQLINFMVEGYLDLGTTKMAKILEQASEEQKKIINNFGYNSYMDNETIKPTEEDIRLAELALEKANQQQEEQLKKLNNIQENNLIALEEP